MVQRVYLGNLDPSISKEEITDEVGRFGKLVDVWVARNPPGFAFITFEDDRDAQDMMNDLSGGNGRLGRVKIEMARNQGGRQAGPSGGREGGYAVGSAAASFGASGSDGRPPLSRLARTCVALARTFARSRPPPRRRSLASPHSPHAASPPPGTPVRCSPPPRGRRSPISAQPRRTLVGPSGALRTALASSLRAPRSCRRAAACLAAPAVEASVARLVRVSRLVSSRLRATATALAHGAAASAAPLRGRRPVRRVTVFAWALACE
ncbi:hypothetical protein EMIHUDRAFT_440007 [Emiliania huxleyi CCMP1516]|uniref:RRM domain-containing protein n=2 Tax=Emiliania huxleyi TaxID=2903 RepID=A0A0D3KSL4_EMIH1|nr:hypothetical protein EMIHUDRAFT_440007 [Emiliania huxleyi CCMP1516]EOD38749.1 hypothetical protein EMIHUDRAFT_440007 [Emiliania huxleyi CCMP1516]|eukprot:XP_005791178.1 hypothetical protein EMIHUDRAFT_440007 [Emiliania huxleyi CCMP1516]